MPISWSGRPSPSASRPRKYVKEVDYFGLVSGRTTDKFAATKLTPVKSKLVDAPYVKEFPLVLECKLVHVAELGLHTQFVGEVIDAKADESIIGDGGAIDIKKLKPLVFTPDTQDYYGIGKFVGKGVLGRQRHLIATAPARAAREPVRPD